jgi:hypothetical protein
MRSWHYEAQQRKRRDLYWVAALALLALFSAPLVSTFLVSCDGNGSDDDDDTYVDSRPKPTQCANPGDCPCGGPSDCPPRWVCAVYTGRVAYCVEPAGDPCERQSDCPDDWNCQGLNCSLGNGAAGCGYGVCLLNEYESCETDMDCPYPGDLCIAPGAPDLANTVCYYGGQ